MRKSNKTTIAALAAAVALLANAVSESLRDGLDFGDIATIAGAIMIALQGYFSRDDDVTSEGTLATKGLPPAKAVR